MKPLALAALSLSLIAVGASASTTVPRVDAVADAAPADRLSIPCSASRVNDADLRRVLGILDSRDTPYLRQGLHHAVQDACAQNVARIVVTRRGMAVEWRPALASDGAVAIALR